MAITGAGFKAIKQVSFPHCIPNPTACRLPIPELDVTGIVRACGAVHDRMRETLQDTGRILARQYAENRTTRVPVTSKPEDIHIVVAGGRSYWAAVLPGWGSFGGYAATVQIKRQGG